MRILVSTILLSSCALGGMVQAQTLPKLSDMGLTPIASASFYCEEEAYSISMEMAYEDGRLSQFHGTSTYSECTVQFAPLQMTLVSEDMPEVLYRDIVLNEAGCATSWTTCVGALEYQCSATYNDRNQVISMQLEEDESFTLTWEDDNLTHIELYEQGHWYYESFDITYTDRPSQGLIIQAFTPSFDEFGFFAFSGLLGVTSKNLPLQMQNHSDGDIYSDIYYYDYEYDDHDRVTCAQVNFNGGHTDYRRYTYPQDTERLGAIMSVGTPGTRKTTQGIVRTLPDGTQRVYDYLGR